MPSKGCRHRWLQHCGSPKRKAVEHRKHRQPVPASCSRFAAYCSPCALFADVTVLLNSIAIVMGPTPPGTGVIQPATPATGP